LSTEPRALTAALSSPAFVTRGGSAAMHAANRHVERWAPEAEANRLRPLRNLGFVDRLVSPWIESAQRSASMRMFSQYISNGVSERNPTTNVSWVFPRPWYQDELDWMAAAREVGAQTAVQQSSAPSMLTTRGTYVAPQSRASQIALPSLLHEYVAPSLSVARPDVTGEAYSPLVPFAAAQAAHVMAHAVAPLGGQGAAARMSPGLRAVLTSMLERTTRAQPDALPTRAALSAPHMVTPPAPTAGIGLQASGFGSESESATQIADRYSEQHAQLADLQRMARAAAEREHAQREAARIAQHVVQPAAQASTEAQLAEIRAAQARAIEQRQAEIQRRLGETGARRDDAAAQERAAAAAAERQRLEERVAQRIAATRQHETLKLHEQSREAAARDARSAVAPAVETRAQETAAPRENRVALEIAAAVAALPPELAAMVTAGISQRPERAVQAIAELGEALRSVELIARNSAAGGSFEPTRGPRVVMPAGLGGLVSTVERTTMTDRAMPRMPAAFAPPGAAPIAGARMPALPFLHSARATTTAAPTSALGATTSAIPAALSHVAWSDRWLARFAGANRQSLDVLAAAASPESRLQLLAAGAPHSVFVAPVFDIEDRTQEAAASGEVGFEVGFSPKASVPAVARIADVLPTLRGGPAPTQPAVRFDDDAETPDEMFAAISMSVSRSRSGAFAPTVPPAPKPTLPPVDPDRYQPHDTLADLVAHASPSAPGAGLSAQLASSPFAPAMRHLLPLGVAPSFDVRALFGAGLSSTYLAGLLAADTSQISIAAPSFIAPSFDAFEPIARTAPDLDMTYVAPERAAADDSEAVQPLGYDALLTTLRSALLSWDVETVAADGGELETRMFAPSAKATSNGRLARTMIDSLALPMLGDSAAAYDAFGDASHATTYAAPGMIAERAQAWSVAQERSSSDLAFDFVTPELVLAARVYGLGPAEAAQAARLAVAGPGQLTAMAGAVDRTFVQAMAIEAERRGERTRVVSAYPIAAEVGASGVRDASYSPSQDNPTFAPTASTFGIARRAPRGAFLWPAATSAALGLNAAGPDSEQSMSVAALELLAAQAVAELGTFTALSELGPIADGASGAVAGTAVLGPAVEPRDEDVLATAGALVPASRRDKFQALYVALSQSPSGRTASPAARAARALALAGRGEETVSARERATVAWDVLPVVYGIADGDDGATLSTGDAATRAVRRREELRALDLTSPSTFVDSRPGLSTLSSRAGEALGSYVSPTAAAVSSSSSSSSSREAGAVLRAPTAAPELVQTGRPAGRFGGGEVEIPAWFEEAARKMFEQKTNVSEGISLAELTLVTAAPAQQIAASTRSATGHAPHTPAPAAAAGAESLQVDVEKLANDVYREVLDLMEIARARNGEPYL
jgi:hypothetical protein